MYFVAKALQVNKMSWRQMSISNCRLTVNAGRVFESPMKPCCRNLEP